MGVALEEHEVGLAHDRCIHIIHGRGKDLAANQRILLFGQKSISSTPLGSPATTATMMDFAARHNIAPVVEHFPLSEVNEAIEHLRSGNARYRSVLDNS